MAISRIVCNFFWHRGPLNWVALASLKSFLSYRENEVVVYSYDPSTAPKIKGLSWLPADEIMPYEIAESYLLKMKSFAAVSHLFRYQLLLQKGGWFFDTDCILHRSLNGLNALPIVFGYQSRHSANVSVLKFPAGLKLFREMYDEAKELPPEFYQWGMTGAQLFQKYVEKYQLRNYGLSANYFYPVKFSEICAFTTKLSIPSNTVIVHMWNETLTKHNFKRYQIHNSVLGEVSEPAIWKLLRIRDKAVWHLQNFLKPRTA